MAKQIINVGTVPDDGTGDTLRVAFTKAKDNFDELYAATENIVLDVSELTDEQNLLFDKNYDSLDNLPTIPSDISGLTDEQNLLFDGDYNNLDNLPTIATDISGLTDSSNLLIIKDHLELTNRLVTDPTSLVFFVKPPDTSSDEVFDEIDTNLILTRDATGIGGLGGGIYNKALETEWEAVESPLGTEWNVDGWDNFDNVKLRFYEPLREVFRNRIGNNIVGAKLVMHDTINDKYYKIEFTQWQQGADHNGNFAYTRELIDTTPDVGIVYPDGSIQVSSPQPFTGFREIYLGDTSQYDIQPKDRGKYIEAFNTTIFIPNEETYEFPLGSFIFFVAENGPITLEARDEAIIYGPDGILTSSWVIPARTTATIIKTNANTWNITGRLLTFTGNVVGSNDQLLVDSVNSKIVGPIEIGSNNAITFKTDQDPNTWSDGSIETSFYSYQINFPTNQPTVTSPLIVGWNDYTYLQPFLPTDIGGTEGSQGFVKRSLSLQGGNATDTRAPGMLLLSGGSNSSAGLFGDVRINTTGGDTKIGNVSSTTTIEGNANFSNATTSGINYGDLVGMLSGDGIAFQFGYSTIDFLSTVDGDFTLGGSVLALQFTATENAQAARINISGITGNSSAGTGLIYIQRRVNSGDWNVWNSFVVKGSGDHFSHTFIDFYDTNLTTNDIVAGDIVEYKLTNGTSNTAYSNNISGNVDFELFFGFQFTATEIQVNHSLVQP